MVKLGGMAQTSMLPVIVNWDLIFEVPPNAGGCEDGQMDYKCAGEAALLKVLAMAAAYYPVLIVL